MYLGYLTNCVALKKMGGYAYLKLTNSKIQIRFMGGKTKKQKKVATKNEKSHELKELIKNAIHQRRKGSGI